VGAAVGRAWVPRFRRPVEVWLGLALLAGPLAPSLARSASPPVDGMEAASATLDEAEQMLAADDVDAAIARFEAALDQIPSEPGYAPTRAQVLLTIVEAHEAGFARDGDLERLRGAKRLLDRYLGPLELLDEQGRAAAEERRVRLIDVIGAIEEKQRAEEAARAALARRERATKARRMGRHLSATGAALTGLGGAGLIVMATGIGLGRATDEQIEQAKADALARGDDWSAPCIDDTCREERRAELDPLLARGSASNALVIVGAVTGAALVSTGATLLAVGRRMKNEAKALEVTPTASPTSFGVLLQGRF
jgi:hypothetical protein